MNKWIRRGAAWAWLLVVSAVVPAQAQAQTQAAGPVPAEVFVKPAKMASAALSPSGRWLAALSSQDNTRVGFLVVDLDGKEPSQFIEAGQKDDVSWFRWVTDDWLVFRVMDPLDRSPSGMGAGLMSVSRDGKKSQMLIARQWDVADPFRRRRALEPNHYFYAMGAPGSTEVIIAERHWDVQYEYSHTSMKAIDVVSGEARTITGGAPKSGGWLIDTKGRARVSWSTSGADTIVYWADAKTGAWREVSKAPTYQQPFVPQYVQGDDEMVVATATHEGGMELRRFDFNTMKPAADVLLSTPGFDAPVDLVVDRGQNQTLGLRVEVDAQTSVWFTSAMRQVQAKVDAQFPGRVNSVSCAPCDGKNVRVLVFSYTDNDPGMFVLYRPAEDKWQLIGKRRPDVDPARMALMDLHRTKARDGADLPLWVTRTPAPAGTTATPGPAVVLVHGGPHARGSIWGWHARAQFLASRGYVVIEPEFRGSTGYGDKHMHAGFKQWGLAMQDDISDALKFAVKQGWVDPSRVCIMGGSYGGYAALMGVVKDPDQYRCAVAFAAVTDPRNMFDFHWNDFSSNTRNYSLPVTLGDRKADEARFIATSPVEQAARIKVPVMLVHGAVDKRVPIQNSERMLDALRKNGKAVEWVRYADEGHGFFYEKNELDYLARVERFLAQSLK